jgi:hypothetical protein
MEQKYKSNESSSGSTTAQPRYSLRKGHGFWQLILAGQEAFFKHEQGAYYVKHLLLSPPPQPIHGLALALKINSLHKRPQAAAEVTSPLTGKTITPGDDARVDELALALEEAESARALRRTQLQLEAIVDNEDTSEPVREEALRDLTAIYDYQKRKAHRTTDAAQKAVRAVRMAITRLQRRLARATDTRGNPDTVLRAFAEHIDRYILTPSARYSRRKTTLAREGLAGSFTYEPPPGTYWSA